MSCRYLSDLIDLGDLNDLCSLSSESSTHDPAGINHMFRPPQEVTDSEHWVTDLEVANLTPHRPPHWFLLSSARPTYRLAALGPADWLSLTYRMAHSRRLFDIVYSTYWGGSRRRKPCRDSCKKKILCNIVTFDRSTDRHCEVIKSRLKG